MLEKSNGESGSRGLVAPTAPDKLLSISDCAISDADWMPETLSLSATFGTDFSTTEHEDEITLQRQAEEYLPTEPVNAANLFSHTNRRDNDNDSDGDDPSVADVDLVFGDGFDLLQDALLSNTVNSALD